MEYSVDQARARDRIAAVLRAAGVDLAAAALLPEGGGPQPTLAVVGKAGSGKTMLLADLVRGLVAAGVEPVSADYESRKQRTKRTLAVLAPTNKAASVLRGRGVPATTIHRILYTPLYHPDYEAIAEWLTGKGDRPKVEGLTEAALDRALAFYRQHPSIPGALASAGLRGLGLHQGLEAARGAAGHRAGRRGVDARRAALRRPAASVLARWCCSAIRRSSRRWAATGGMVFDDLPEDGKLLLHRVHRQAADSPILDLAHALGDPETRFPRLRGPGAAGSAARPAGGDRRAGRRRAPWRGRRCWSGATSRGCG